MEIHINNIAKQYGQQTALDLESLHIKPGELLGIVGNNGAGKTTLFRLMLDLIQASRGSVSINGHVVAGSDHWKAQTGSYLDEGFLIDFMTPEEFFHFTGSLYGMSVSTVDETLTRFERFMSGEILGQGKYIRNLSTGNKQKVGIIAAMLVQPQLLILDEPFNFLDPTSQILIKRLLREENKARSTTMLISSHNLNHITEICTRIVLLEKGKIIKDLTPSDSDLQEIEQYFSVNADDDSLITD
jgi:ABC-2 type transport system ATP-binding protein